MDLSEAVLQEEEEEDLVMVGVEVEGVLLHRSMKWMRILKIWYPGRCPQKDHHRQVGCSEVDHQGGS
jgi:hypothetical protein